MGSFFFFSTGVRTTVLWEPLVLSVTRSVSVRMEPSVITSPEPVCVKQASKALTARRDSAPQASTVLSVTSTAPVTPPTRSGKWDVTTTRTHTHTPALTTLWVESSGAPYTFKRPQLYLTSPWASSHSGVWTSPNLAVQFDFNGNLWLIHNFSAPFIVNAMLMLWFWLQMHRSHYRKEKRDISFIWWYVDA